MEYAKLTKEYEELVRASGKKTQKEEVAKDRGLNHKIEEIVSLMKEMAGKSREQKKEESSEVTEEEISRSGGSKKENDEDQKKMEQLLFAPQNEKQNEDGQGNAEHDLSGSQKKHKAE